jgi:hypothetical protein
MAHVYTHRTAERWTCRLLLNASQGLVAQLPARPVLPGSYQLMIMNEGSGVTEGRHDDGTQDLPAEAAV